MDWVVAYLQLGDSVYGSHAMYGYKHQRSILNPLPDAERVCRCCHTLVLAWHLYVFCSRYVDWSRGRRHPDRRRRHRRRRQV